MCACVWVWGCGGGEMDSMIQSEADRVRQAAASATYHEWAVYLFNPPPLGYFYNAPHWGGGGYFEPPLISETTGPILKIQRHLKDHEKLLRENKFY